MPAPPARASISAPYPNPSNAVARAALGEQYDYVTALLGATGAKAEARVAIGVGPVISNRNRLINGNFRINQRAVAGAVNLSAGQYGHDRWKAGASGCTYTFAGSGADFVLTITAGSLIQVVEAGNVEGGDYCLSWTGTATGKIGAGSLAASGVTASSVTANANLNVEFSTGTLGQVQLEPGLFPTPFERRPLTTELQLCQRYFETGRFFTVLYGLGTAAHNFTVPFRTDKRAAPTIALSGTTSTNATGLASSAPTVDSFLIGFTVTATSTFQISGNYTATAEL